MNGPSPLATPLLPDAETLENVREQIVGRALARDLLERIACDLQVRQDELLRERRPGVCRHDDRADFIASQARSKQVQMPDVGDFGSLARIGSTPTKGTGNPLSESLECRRRSSPRSASVSARPWNPGMSLLFETITCVESARSDTSTASAEDSATLSSVPSSTSIDHIGDAGGPERTRHPFGLDEIGSLSEAGGVDQRQTQSVEVNRLTHQIAGGSGHVGARSRGTIPPAR